MSTTAAAGPRRYRIAEVGRLTGFTPSALRFYEQAGVLSPPERTPAGYRVYGDRDVERLRLVARAKDLGCTLEEIAGLVEAWDADECGPVKHRLHHHSGRQRHDQASRDGGMRRRVRLCR
jgi:DNA-binding transcriptional MerR regulator